jgi:hypothetical protein
MPVHPHKRIHSRDGAAILSSGHLSHTDFHSHGALASYNPEVLPAASADDEAVHWLDEKLAAHPAAPIRLNQAQVAADHQAMSLPAAAADTSAVNRLKLLLANNQAVRQTALKLLQKPQGQCQQLVHLPPQRQPMCAQQQQAPARSQQHDNWGPAASVCNTAAVSAGMRSQASILQAQHLQAAHAGSSNMLRALPQQRQPQQCSQRSAMHTDAYGPLSYMPAQQAEAAGAQEDAGLTDWVSELEDQLLGCLEKGPAAGAAAGHPSRIQRSNIPMASRVPPMQQQQLVPRRTHRHFQVPSSCAPQYQQQQQGWATAPLPAAHPPAGRRFSLSMLAPLDLVPGVDGNHSPDPVGSASSSTNNSFGMARSGHSSQTHASVGQVFCSQPLPMLGAQEQQGWSHMCAGLKRHNSVDQDEVRHC